MTFQTWVAKKGGPTSVAKLLGVEAPCVRTWVRRQAAPRPSMILKIASRSGGQLSALDIIHSTLKSKR